MPVKYIVYCLVKIWKVDFAQRHAGDTLTETVRVLVVHASVDKDGKTCAAFPSSTLTKSDRNLRSGCKDRKINLSLFMAFAIAVCGISVAAIIWAT
jgi:hypothetical protein